MRPRPARLNAGRVPSVCSTVNAEASATIRITSMAAMAPRMCPHPASAVSLAIPWRQWSKRQIGNNTLALPTALIENDLIHAAQHAFHRFEIESFARHLGRFLILLIDLVEAGNLAGCLSDGLKPVAFRLLNN